MFNNNFRKERKVLDSFERARLVSIITCIFSLFYHISIFVFFLVINLKPMVYYNIISISIFVLLLIFVNKAKNFIFPFLIALTEVIIHQVLAEYFLGTLPAFHFFILLMGFLPYLVFEKKFGLSVPVTTITSFLFIIMENMQIMPVYEISDKILRSIRLINISISIVVILSMILVNTIFVLNMEGHLRKQNDFLGKEIKLASSIQQNFFKQDVTAVDGWDVGYCNQPMSGVSGDLYDFYRDGSKLEGFGVFDVSGHGISSGLVTMLVKNIIYQEFYNNQEIELWETLLNINDKVIEAKGDIENYLTGILAKVKDENTIEFVNASHPLPIVYRAATGELELIPRKTEALGAIGIKDFPTFYESQFVTLEPGDEFILYTDGAIDCMNKNNEEFGIERLKESIKSVVNFPASEQIYLLLNEMNDFRGMVEPKDDITLMIVKK